jgi:hypothetical protein
MPPSPSASMIGTPSTIVVARIEDPDLSINLPPQWRTQPISELRSGIEQQAAASSGVLHDIYLRLLADIDAGAMRLFAFGPSGFENWPASLLIEVTDAPSVEAQIVAIKARWAKVGKPTSSDRRTVTLRMGSMERLSQTAGPPVGVTGPTLASRTIDYVAKLDDGRILWVTSTGPETSPIFADLIDIAVATLGR